MTKLGTFRAVYIAALSCVGSFLFAYDTGIVGGLLTLDSFQRDMNFTNAQKANVSSLSASLLQAGAFFSCFFAWPFTARFGRRWSIALASFIFCIGCILQVINSNGLATFYAGRVISGVGVGVATVIIPMYSAETAPKEIRGQLGSLFQFFFTLGVMTSYWVDYGVAQNLPPTSRQWQIPVGLQLIPGGILGLGMLLTRESPRWLAKRGDLDAAAKSLIWIRGGDTVEVREELADICAGIEEERHITEGVTWKEYLLPANRLRLFLAITLQAGGQFTGNTSLAYFSPQVFASVGAGNNALLLSGFFGLVKVVSCGFFLLFLIERVGRKMPLAIGALMMGVYMLIVGILAKEFPPKSNSSGNFSSPAIASVCMIYLEAMTYNCSWGPVVWLYISEIFPTRIREGGTAAGAATQWLFNFAFSQITPHAINNLGWKTFIMFAIFNFALVFYVWFFIKETKGKSLEEMEHVFNSPHAVDFAKLHSQVRVEAGREEVEVR